MLLVVSFLLCLSIVVDIGNVETVEDLLILNGDVFLSVPEIYYWCKAKSVFLVSGTRFVYLFVRIV